MGNPYMQPDYEPIRSLVYSANDRAIKDVYVDGRQVVRDGTVLHFDIGEDIEMLRKAQTEAVAAAPQRDWAGRGLDKLSPRLFPVCS
jgi:cytosine/adenosine deaminase-related metal-dependent hydrolase